jgi:hypothetical protein
MTTNPIYSALFAISYIVLLVTAMNFAGTYLQAIEDNVFMPMGMIAILVLSVALMGYLFFYQPLVYLTDGHREKAVKHFLHSVAAFAVFTVFLIATALAIGVYQK